jgi:nucleoside phosphorylase
MASDLDYDSESDVDLDYEDYTVAWIAPLEIEKQAALGMLDKRHKGKFTTHRGDDYLYAAGEIKGHNVVIATFPAGHDYGNSSAAALASQVKNNFPNLWFGLLVGVAAGLPNLSSKPPRDIRLGDVLVGVGDRDSAGVVCYDLGRETPTGFKPLRRGDQPKTLPIVSSAIGQIKNPAQTNKNVFLKYYKSIKDQSTFVDPGQEKDRLYQTVKDGNGSATRLVERRFRSPSERTTVWYGPIGSGNKLMRDAQTRDRLRDQHNLIGLEMEGASILNIIPVGVIRGVCDYGDSQKDKIWQPYAAAMAAAYAKALLSEIKPYKTRRVGVLPAPKVLSVRKASKVPKGSVLNMERDKDMEDESEAGSEEEDEEEASVKKRFEEIKHNLRNDKINLRDTDEFEKFAEHNKDYLGKTTAAADGHNTLLHLLVDDAKDRVFDKYKPLFKLLIDSYPELPEIKDISDRTPLYISISKKREMLVRFMCDTHPNIDVILGISCLRTDYCLHVAIKKNVNPDLTIFLIEHAGEWALCAQDDMGKTPLHLAVEYERCTDAQLQVVKALIRRCDKAMNKRTIEPNCFSPYRYHEYTRAEAKKAAEAEAKKAAKQKKKEKESEDAKITERSTDAIMNFLKLHCMHTMKHDDAVNFLYGRNQGISLSSRTKISQ